MTATVARRGHFACEVPATHRRRLHGFGPRPPARRELPSVDPRTARDQKPHPHGPAVASRRAFLGEPRARRPGAVGADPRCRGREPQSRGRQRGVARDRPCLRCVADGADLVAVGYSLGLAASVLWLGALGDRYGRKLMLVLGMALSVPACILAAWAPSIGVLIFARIIGGLSAGMAFPTTLALITALWSGARANEVDRVVVGDRRRDRRARPVGVGRVARAFLVGLGVPRHAPAGGDRARHGGQVRPEPCERDDRCGRQPRRHPLGGARGYVRARHQLRPGPESGSRRSGLAGDRRRRDDCVRHPAAPCRESALRPEDRRRGGPSGWLRWPASSCSAR